MPRHGSGGGSTGRLCGDRLEQQGSSRRSSRDPTAGRRGLCGRSNGGGHAGLGSFDHLVFTAGETLQLGPLADTDLAAARRFFDLRYRGAYGAAKYAAGSIRPRGSIVFTSGLAGARPHAGWSLGASICSAMEGLTRALAVELAPIRVNIVSPGVVRSPLWSNMTEENRRALYSRMAASLPVGHVGEVEEIAKAYLYLMQQTYGTGQVLGVDGGGALA
jgi:NAD(P)-dependent dehydrogenase (short-subunit alcohol dehydrogenase family)